MYWGQIINNFIHKKTNFETEIGECLPWSFSWFPPSLVTRNNLSKDNPATTNYPGPASLVHTEPATTEQRSFSLHCFDHYRVHEQKVSCRIFSEVSKFVSFKRFIWANLYSTFFKLDSTLYKFEDVKMENDKNHSLYIIKITCNLPWLPNKESWYLKFRNLK